MERTNNLLVQTFAVNNVNELSSISRSGTLTVAGSATEWSGNSPYNNYPGVSNVTVNSQSANIYGDGSFAAGGFTPQGGVNLYGFVANNPVSNIDPLGLVVGTVRILNWSPYVANSWYSHSRGWLYGVSWSPPSGGDWNQPCNCKPCQKVIWTQDAAFGKGSQFYPDVTAADYAKYGYAWDCTQNGSVGAAFYDRPDQHGLFVSLFTSPYSFYAKSYATCAAGKDAGKVYATVLWGFTWTYDTTPTGLGPIIE